LITDDFGLNEKQKLKNETSYAFLMGVLGINQYSSHIESLRHGGERIWKIEPLMHWIKRTIREGHYCYPKLE